MSASGCATGTSSGGVIVGGGGCNRGLAATNDDAAASKMYAVSLGYYRDPYLRHFLRTSPSKKPPLINRGHYSRVAAMDCAVRSLVEFGVTQIVNLGCGFDTLFFRLKAENVLTTVTTWYDIDMDTVIQQKRAIVEGTPALTSLASDGATKYILRSVDLSNLESVKESLRDCDPNQSTLFISEVVLVYLDPGAGTSIIAWAAEHFTTACFATYEQIRPLDPFGRTMVSNLQRMGYPLLSIMEYPDEQAQRKRYLNCGYQVVTVDNMLSVHNALVASDPREAGRVNRLELFDELEEWGLIQQHYCFIIAIKQASGTPTFTRKWKLSLSRF
ncbi:leucine carboxyl methyltransferase [Pelomyxa schiedti]|nr:leucine carboxyl methyltransferase [Pelomyxa schiedti]